MITSESSPGAWPVEEPSKFHLGLKALSTETPKKRKAFEKISTKKDDGIEPGGKVRPKTLKCTFYVMTWKAFQSTVKGREGGREERREGGTEGGRRVAAAAACFASQTNDLQVGMHACAWQIAIILSTRDVCFCLQVCDDENKPFFSSSSLLIGRRISTDNEGVVSWDAFMLMGGKSRKNPKHTRQVTSHTSCSILKEHM